MDSSTSTETRSPSVFPAQPKTSLILPEGRPTFLMPFDRMIVDLRRGFISFTRGSVKMYFSSPEGHRDDKMEFVHVPSIMDANVLAKMVAALHGLGIQRVKRTDEQVIYEFI